jgi:hypothetical protein
LEQPHAGVVGRDQQLLGQTPRGVQGGFGDGQCRVRPTASSGRGFGFAGFLEGASGLLVAERRGGEPGEARDLAAVLKLASPVPGFYLIK